MFQGEVRGSRQENRHQGTRLSGFQTPAFDAMKETVEALEAAGLRKDLKS
jgi:methanogenic corrinoid protein MtbC1